MRRYTLTIILLIILFAVGGLALANVASGEPDLTRGAYVPTFSDDPATAQLQALIFLGALVAIIGSTLGLGIVLAITFTRFTRMLDSYPTAGDTSERASGPRQTTKQELGIPLSSERSTAIFWIVVAVLVIGFQVIRLWDEPLGYLPGLGDMLNMPLFRLPGQHIEGLPSFIVGPGDEVTALHLFLAVLGAVLVSTIIAGIGMARGVGVLTNFMSTADQRPPTLPDRMIPMVEERLARLREPRPRKRRAAGNPFDTLLVGLNALLFLTIGGIIAFYVIPSYSGVAAVENALQATRVAGLATATPQGSDGQQGGGQTRVEVLQAKLDALPAGNAAGGQATFTSAGCSACHSLDAGVQIVGPSLDGIGARAGNTRPDYSAPLYIFESITDPNAYVVEGFQAGIMPQTFEQILQPQQLADLVAFLSSE